MKWWKIGVVVAVHVVLVVVAGVIFHLLESKEGFAAAAVVSNELETFRATHPCISQEDMKRLFKTIDRTTILKLKYRNGNFIGTSWDYLSSTYSALQIIGSIGFGASPPQSTGGKVFLLFYAILGIPLFVCVVFGCSLQLLGLSDVIRRFFWKSASLKDYIWVHIVRTFILLLLGFIFLCLVPTAIFKNFDPDLDFWQTVAIISVVFIGPGQFQPAQLPNPTMNQRYRLVVGLWTMVYTLWFAGVVNTTFRVIVERYDRDGVDIPGSLTFGNKDKAIVSRVWVNHGGGRRDEEDGDDGEKKNGGIRWRNCCGRNRKGENDNDDDNGGGGGRYFDNGGRVNGGFVSGNGNYRRDGGGDFGRVVTGNVNVIKVGK